MDLNFSADEIAFREEVRGFVAANLPADIRDRVRRGDDAQLADDLRRWQKILHAKGWGAAMWPAEFGGTGWDKTRQYLFDIECIAADAPIQLPFGLKMVAPVIMRYGSQAQKERFLPRILDATDWWCQGYSEPGSGSDLASLKTRAERDGDHYVVNGQKAWNTLGQFADWIFCLVRTDATSKPQKGISFLLIDMKTPGITVKPIITLGGEHEVNEVWLDNVKVPVENRVYEENKGWTCAKFLLAHERTGIAGVARSKRGIEKLKDIARAQQDGQGQPLLANPFFRRKVVELETDLTALEFTELRTLAGEASGKGPGPESSLLKVKGTEIQQRLTELVLEAAGNYAAPYFRDFPEGSNEYPIGPEFAHRAAPTYFNMRKTSIYGGSNEIQRNIIAKMVLGL